MNFIKIIRIFSLVNLIFGFCHYSLDAKQSTTQTQLPNTPKTEEVSAAPTSLPEKKESKDLITNKALQAQYDKANAALPGKLQEIREQLLQGDISPAKGVEKIKNENQKVNQLQQKLQELAQQSEISEEGGLWSYLKSGAQSAMASIRSLYAYSPEEQKLAKLLVGQLMAQKDDTEKDYQNLSQAIADSKGQEELKNRRAEINAQFDNAIYEQKIIAGLERSTAKKIAIGGALAGAALAGLALQRSLGDSTVSINQNPDLNANTGSQDKTSGNGSGLGGAKEKEPTPAPTKPEPTPTKTPALTPEQKPVSTPTTVPVPEQKPVIPTPEKTPEQKPESTGEPKKSLTGKILDWGSQTVTSMKDTTKKKIQEIMEPSYETEAQKIQKELRAQEERLSIAEGKEKEARARNIMQERQLLEKEYKYHEEEKKQKDRLKVVEQEIAEKRKQEVALEAELLEQEYQYHDRLAAAEQEIAEKRKQEVALETELLEQEYQYKDRLAAAEQEMADRRKKEVAIEAELLEQEYQYKDRLAAAEQEIADRRKKEVAIEAELLEQEYQYNDRMAAAEQEIADRRKKEVAIERELLEQEYRYNEEKEKKQLESQQKKEANEGVSTAQAQPAEKPAPTEEAKPKIEPIIVSQKRAEELRNQFNADKKKLENKLKELGSEKSLEDKIEAAKKGLNKKQAEFDDLPASTRRQLNSKKAVELNRAKEELKNAESNLQRFREIPGELETIKLKLEAIKTK